MSEERRVDPEDGAAYTYDELALFYKGKYKKKEIDEYWSSTCSAVQTQGKSKTKAKARAKSEGAATEKAAPIGQAPQGKAKAKAKAKAKVEQEPAKESTSLIGQAPNASKPSLKRTKSWLVKVGGIALLPCEEDLAPLVEEYAALREVGDAVGMDAVQLRVLQSHPFVTKQNKPVKSEALAAGVTCEAFNFKMNVNSFQKWLKKPEGKPFAEKGKGYDDGCYLTSQVLRTFMPRGYTTFVFKSADGETASVILRGFFKFTGLTATDEDEESGATAEVDAFMFHGYKRADAERFVVTTKSNGENGKYTVRKVFGEWYCFAGSKNTGVVWKLDLDATALYPIPTDASNDGAAQVGPKIVKVIHGILNGMTADTRTAFLETVDKDGSTIMIELNDPMHEHIFPIHDLLADHVAVLSNIGYPLPQRDAFALFDRFGLHRVACDVYDDVSRLEAVMEEIRASKETEGAVIYLERKDDKPVGLVKVKSDHYVIARRTRETVRGALVSPLEKGASFEEALRTTRNRLTKGMKELSHVGGCKEHHTEWADFAIAFAESWATAYNKGTAATKKALVNEFRSKYGSMYMNFWKAWQEGKKDAPPVLLLGA